MIKDVELLTLPLPDNVDELKFYVNGVDCTDAVKSGTFAKLFVRTRVGAKGRLKNMGMIEAAIRFGDMETIPRVDPRGIDLQLLKHPPVASHDAKTTTEVVALENPKKKAKKAVKKTRRKKASKKQ